MKVTPDQIRAEQRELTFTAAECAVIADALEIADSCARADIESMAIHVCSEAGRRWYDSARVYPNEPESITVVGMAIRYLDARGLLIRYRGEPHIVSFNDSPHQE